MFELLSSVFHEALYRPLFNGLIFLYNIIPGHDFGLAIISLTLLVRLALYPSSMKAITPGCVRNLSNIASRTSSLLALILPI